MAKRRLDVYLFEKGYFDSREKAKAAVLAGEVFIDGIRVTKAGTPVADSVSVTVKQRENIYVGRGGLKLKRALDFFEIDVQNKVFLDIGASTGGFTDCLLRSGARKVWAIDVGYGQLDYKLRTDERVTVLEKTNFRHLQFEAVGERADGFVMDVSFISVLKLTENLKQFLKDGAEGIILIKPQFEGARALVEKHGIVKKPSVHIDILNGVVTALYDSGYSVEGLTYSGIKGAKGNIEFLLYIKHNMLLKKQLDTFEVKRVVEEAHTELSV